MSEHINPTPPGRQNFHAVSLNYLADVWGVSKAEARVLHRRMHDDPWLDAPTLCLSPSTLPSAEDRLVKLPERHPDLVASKTAPERLERVDG